MSERKEFTSERVYRTLKKEISERKYFPGEHLVEAALVDTLGCSRATMRSILLRLEDDGLLEHIPNRGFFVRKITLEELLEIEVIMQDLEVLAARLAAQKPDARSIEPMRQLAGMLQKYVESGDTAKADQQAVQFHLQLAKASGNKQLFHLLDQYYSTLLKSTQGISSPVRAPDDSSQLDYLNFFGAVISAIESGNADLAGELMFRYFQQGIEKIKEAPPPWVMY